jgi:hypothetical protein
LNYNSEKSWEHVDSKNIGFISKWILTYNLFLCF